MTPHGSTRPDASLPPADDAVAAEPAPPGAPGHAEELDELADVVSELRPGGRELDEEVLVDGLPAWRQGYPYDAKLSRREYERTKRLLQIELIKLQAHVKDSGLKIAVLFEGRDAAGKGGAIKRFMEHLNPRGARVVALTVPTPQERSQWYFQRYVAHLPSAGEIVLFDRSWYNRAGVERVMGYCSPTEYLNFMRETPDFERMLVHSGLHLVKLWFSVSPGEQAVRFAARSKDPVRQWKLSPTDLASLDKWDAYTAAKETMFFHTDTGDAPWTVVKSNDKKRARLEAMRVLLSQVDYPGKDHVLVGQPDPRIVGPADQVHEDDEDPARHFPPLSPGEPSAAPPSARAERLLR